MKTLKRALSFVLTFCMLFSMTISGFAAELTISDSAGEGDIAVASTAAVDGYDYSLVMVDCGRKYFSVDSLKSIIDSASSAGMHYVMLGIGNDGLRFLLDDMSLTVSSTEYDSKTVSAAIHAGNEAYSNFDTDELTESEMDEIISYAGTKGVEIVPMINTPGHMDAILDCIESCTNTTASYNGSVRTIDVTNSTATAFTKALLQKYITYFAGKGCTLFNMGCDEYANDKYSSGGMGFGNLVSSGKYSSFVTYVNDVAALVKKAGMTPMAFNDGIYYNNNTSSGTFDTDIMICYWSSGWSTYSVASASTLAAKGFKMINTHGDYYWIVGGNQCTADKASEFNINTFMGSTISNPAGAMFCIWSDYPQAQTDDAVATAVAPVISAFGGTLPETEARTSHKDTDSGEDPATETVQDEATGIAVTAEGLTGITVTEATAPAIDGADHVIAYDVTPKNADGAYTGEATVSFPVPDDWNTDKLYGFVITDGKLETVEGTYDSTSKTYSFTAPHFSVMGVYDIASTSEESSVEKIELTVDETKTVIQENVNNKNNVNTENLSEDIAKVEVTGQDEVKATTTYTEASVTCNTLISSNSNNWTAASGYYYTPDGTNYYPVYAKRSTSYSFYYTYTWGYSTTGSASNVTQIGDTQSVSWWDASSTEPNITVYTQSTTAATPASTTITITGVAPGTTYVTVGDTTYKIVVNYKTETVNAILGQTKKVTVSGELDKSELNTSIATVEVSGETMTVTGVTVGETKVTVGNTIYTIKVTEEDLSAVTPLTIEYWITNGRPTDNGENSYNVVALKAASEDGIAVADFLPANTTKETRTLQYWRCRLLDTTLNNSSTSGTEEQTETAGDDETYNGVEFTKVRYWNGTWAVYTENDEWVAVTNNYQLVAYYLEILPVSDELTVTAADWGKKGDGSTSGDYLDPSSSCTVSVQVIYEDGTTNPASTTAADLMSTTIAYGYWSGGRGIGTLNLAGLEGYQIWKVEAETGAETYANSSSMWGSFKVDSFTWDNNAMTVYEGDPVDSYIIHNDAHNPSTEGYYANLMWDENYEAILIKVYVKAKPTDETLKVVYYDEKFGDELYTYNINVKNGVDFSNITPTPSAFAENNERIDVTGCGIKNTLGVTQKFQTDLTKVPEAVGKYSNSLYSYTGSVISEDRKTLYLYYNINTEALSPMYVIDFGLPITFSLSDVVAEGQEDLVKNISSVSARYGDVTYDASKKTFTYTPDQILPNIDVLTINILFDGVETATITNVGVVPATTVYYEEGFATLNGFSGGSKGTGTQATQVAGSSTDEYGYDVKYADESADASNGTEAASTAIGDKAELSFTGTGIDIYANTDTDTGRLLINVKDSDGNTKKLIQVDTAMVNGTTDATSEQAVEAYNVPVASITGLTYDDYTATITHTKSSSDDSGKTVNLDGFRVYSTIDPEPEFYTADEEDNPTFIELRDQVLAGLSVTSDGSGQVNAALPTDTTVAVVASSDKYTKENVDDLLKNGPKNEIYLQQNQALVLKITTNREVQIGLKALNAATTYTITGKDGDQTISSSTDMFYTVLNKSETEKRTEQTITITNTGNGILSVTKLKVCDDPDAALATLTADDLNDALVALGIIESEATEPTEPEVNYADATLTITVKDILGRKIGTKTLTYTGEEGESHTFTKAEIKAAVTEVAEQAGYKLSSMNSYKAVTVKCGESATASYYVSLLKSKRK